MLAQNWAKKIKAVTYNQVTALLEYLDLVMEALCLQVVIFSAAEEYSFDFYNFRN